MEWRAESRFWRARELRSRIADRSVTGLSVLGDCRRQNIRYLRGVGLAARGGVDTEVPGVGAVCRRW